MRDDCGDADLREPISDVDRLLLFEWHAAHLESWLETFPPSKSVNITYGMSAREFHTATMLLALLRKFYSGEDSVSLGGVIGALRRAGLDLPRDLGKQLRRLEKEYKGPQGPLDARHPSKVDGEEYRSTIDYMWDVTYGLMIHSDPDKGARLRSAGRMLHGQASIPDASETVLNLLRRIRWGRARGVLDLPPAHPPVWIPRPRDEVVMTLDEAARFLGWGRHASDS